MVSVRSVLGAEEIGGFEIHRDPGGFKAVAGQGDRLWSSATGPWRVTGRTDLVRDVVHDRSSNGWISWLTLFEVAIFALQVLRKLENYGVE
jgi:hypothetical protein